MVTKRLGCNLQVFLVEEPLKLPVLWNLLVQPYVRKFQRRLELLCLHA